MEPNDGRVSLKLQLELTGLIEKRDLLTFVSVKNREMWRSIAGNTLFAGVEKRK